MTQSPTAAAPRRRGRAMWSAAILTLLLTSLSAGGSLGAQTGCGTYSFDFDGTRLLNDGISNRAGPFDIEMPAGTYTVTLVASDHHDTQVGVGTQPGEQFHVILDSGYVSGDSIDIPDDENTTTTTFVDQVIGESRQITVEHGGVPGINSVNPVCVGFTPVETPAVDQVADSPNEVEPETDPATAPAVSADAPKDDPASEPAVADPIEPEEDIEVEVEGIVELPEEAPIQELVPPVSIVRNEADAVDTAVEEQVVEVLAVAVSDAEAAAAADSPAEVLAVTGSGEVTQLLVMIGAVLLALGGLCIRWAQSA